MNFSNDREETSYEEIAAWFSPADAISSHVFAQKLHEAKAGAWLCRSKKYKAWLSNEYAHFWLNGKPGSGKTILCSTIIEDLKRHCNAVENSAVAFFYFSFSDVKKQSFDNMLRSVITQIAAYDQEVLSELRKAHKRNELMETYKLERLLLSYNPSNHLYVVLDALDECPEEGDLREDMLDGLLSVIQHVSKIKLFVTSRDLTSIREAMTNPDIVQTSIAVENANADIRRYLTAQLATDRRLARFSSETKLDINNTIAARSDGMFRWAHLQLQTMKKLDSLRPSHIRDALDSIPKTLDDTYAQILNQIKPSYRDDAVKLLRWIAHANRPLTLAELRDSVIIDLDAQTVHVHDRGDFEDPLRILSGLVVTVKRRSGDHVSNNSSSDENNFSEEYEIHTSKDSRQQRIEEKSPLGRRKSEHLRPRNARNSMENSKTLVRLAHFIVKEYLESDRAKVQAGVFYLWKSMTHHFLTQSCIRYIMFYSHCPENKFRRLNSAGYPLICYASDSWYYHARHHSDVDISSEMTLLASSLYTTHWSCATFLPVGKPKTPSVHDTSSTYGLYFAALLGLKRIVAALLRAGDDVNQVHQLTSGSSYADESSSALAAASQKGNLEIVRILLDAGAHVDALADAKQSALIAASRAGHATILQVLIAYGADVKGIQLSHAIEAAAESRSLRAIRLLLKYARHLDPVSFISLLSTGAVHKPEMIECLLFEDFLPVKTAKKLCNIAFGMVSLEGHTQLVDKFLRNGANKHADLALFSASFGGHVEIARMLLDHGARANIQEDMNGGIQQPLEMFDYEMVGAVLLDCDANENKPVRQNYGGALQAASSEGHLEIMKLLLNHGADVNATGGPYESALFAAGTYDLCGNLYECWSDGRPGYIEFDIFYNEDKDHRGCVRFQAVELLLDHGANVNVLRRGYESVLFAAAAMNDLNLARLLISRGANLEVGRGKFGTAICAAASEGHVEMVKLLAQAGADLDAVGPYGPPLYLAQKAFNLELMDVILEHGANVNARHRGDSLLCLACHRHGTEVLEVLLRHGADLNDAGRSGVPFYLVIKLGNIEAVEMMLKNGANVNAKISGESPLCLALRLRHNIKMVKILLHHGADTNAISQSEQHALAAALSVAEDPKVHAQGTSSASSTDLDHEEMI